MNTTEHESSAAYCGLSYNHPAHDDCCGYLRAAGPADAQPTPRTDALRFIEMIYGSRTKNTDKGRWHKFTETERAVRVLQTLDELVKRERAARQEAERNAELRWGMQAEACKAAEAALAEAERRIEALEAALQELVTLKDMKDSANMGEDRKGLHWIDARAEAEYNRRKGLAWKAGKDALATQKEKS